MAQHEPRDEPGRRMRARRIRRPSATHPLHRKDWLYDSAGRHVEYAGWPEPGAAKAYAAAHPVLCAHADQDDTGSHWLDPGKRCPGRDAEAGQ